MINVIVIVIVIVSIQIEKSIESSWNLWMIYDSLHTENAYKCRPVLVMVHDSGSIILLIMFSIFNFNKRKNFKLKS